MNKNTAKSATRLAALELNASRLNACVWQMRGDEVVGVQSLSLKWRHAASSLHSEQGLAELTTAFKRVASELKLQATETWLSLAGDYCVTRVVTGDEDDVRHELAELEARSELYISLGHGPKALAGSIRQIDARRRHALLSVVNQRTLDALSTAAGQAGIRLERIEPALVSLCRLVGRMQVDADSPVLVMHVGEKGADLGISYRGSMLLDYRPAGADNPEELGAVTNRHLARLQRYCQRYARVSGAKLQRVYLAGSPENVSLVTEAIRKQGELEVAPLDQVQAIDKNWTWDRAAPDWSLAVPVGLALLRLEKDRQQLSPNLLERLQRTAKEPLAQLLRPLVVPLAATLLIVASGWAAVWYQSLRCARIERLAAQVESTARDVRMQNARISQSQAWVNHYQRVAAGLEQRRVARIAAHVAQSLPDDVWLEDITLENSGRIVLSGGSYSEDGVFEFAKHLKRIPGLTNVAVDGTRPASFPAGSGTQFDVHGELAEQSAKEDHADGRG
jgi:hypothetical protein